MEQDYHKELMDVYLSGLRVGFDAGFKIALQCLSERIKSEDELPVEKTDGGMAVKTPNSLYFYFLEKSSGDFADEFIKHVIDGGEIKFSEDGKIIPKQ